MRIDDSAMRYETEGLSPMNQKRMQAIAADTMDAIHPDSETIKEAAAQGPLLSPRMESRLSGMVEGRVSNEKSIADELRELLGMTQQANVVGVRKHDGTMGSTSATKYGQLVEALKEMIADAPDGNSDPMNDVSMRPENELNIDEEVGASVRTSEMESELMFLRNQVKQLQREAAAKQALKDNRFSSRGNSQTNRFGIGN